MLQTPVCQVSLEIHPVSCGLCFKWTDLEQSLQTSARTSCAEAGLYTSQSVRGFGVGGVWAGKASSGHLWLRRRIRRSKASVNVISNYRWRTLMISKKEDASYYFLLLGKKWLSLFFCFQRAKAHLSENPPSKNGCRDRNAIGHKEQQIHKEKVPKVTEYFTEYN